MYYLPIHKFSYFLISYSSAGLNVSRYRVICIINKISKISPRKFFTVDRKKDRKEFPRTMELIGLQFEQSSAINNPFFRP